MKHLSYVRIVVINTEALNKMKITHFNRYECDSKTKAFFSIETHEGIVIKGFKLVLGVKWLFMSSPSHFSQKEQKWFDDVYIPKELNEPLEQEVIFLYNVYPTIEEKETSESQKEELDLPF